VDVDICDHNRIAIEAHRLATRIELIQGNSTAHGTLTAVRRSITPSESVLVVLDSNHSRAHVEAELDLYAPLVSPGSYIVACDGIMAQLAGAPRTAPDWTWNNPVAAVDAFLGRNSDFVLEEPAFLFNEGSVRGRVTYWPHSFLKRR
jgi:cephalosporin hydroxylase